MLLQVSNDLLVNCCLIGLKDSICDAYLDDVLAHSISFEQHVKDVRTVLQRLRERGVKLNAKKRVFFKQEIRYLRHLISGEG